MSTIRSVEAIPVRLPRTQATGTAGSPTTLGSSAGAYRWSNSYPVLYSEYLETTLVKVTLSDGTYGWGEAQAPVAPRVAAAIIDDLLGPLLEAAHFDGTQSSIESLWQLMYQTMRVRGHTGGFMLDAISGIDIAFWDLAGKIQNLPVARLLAGEDARAKVATYLSGLAGKDFEARIDYARRHIGEGFTTFKLYFDSDEASLLAALDAMPDGTYVAVDALWRLDLRTGREFIRELADRRLVWLECPFPPEDFASHQELAREHFFRLAVGESYRMRHEFERFFEEELLTYVQPDLGRCGITETRRIAARAAQAGVAVVPHVSIALGPQIAAAIHTAASLPNCKLCEFNPAVFEASNRFLMQPLQTEGPYYRVPEAAGLGVDVDEARLRAASIPFERHT